MLKQVFQSFAFDFRHSIVKLALTNGDSKGTYKSIVRSMKLNDAIGTMNLFELRPNLVFHTVSHSHHSAAFVEHFSNGGELTDMSLRGNIYVWRHRSKEVLQVFNKLDMPFLHRSRTLIHDPSEGE